MLFHEIFSDLINGRKVRSTDWVEDAYIFYDKEAEKLVNNRGIDWNWRINNCLRDNWVFYTPRKTFNELPIGDKFHNKSMIVCIKIPQFGSYNAMDVNGITYTINPDAVVTVCT